MLAANPEVVAKLAALMQRYIEEGRSTPGLAQKNDYELTTGAKAKAKDKAKGNRKNKGQ